MDLNRTHEQPVTLPSDDSVIPVAWYPIAWSREVKSQPIKRRIAGIDVVLFRDASGKPKCLSAYCPHRGADLQLGKCVDGKIRCAYHGWEFDGNGVCEHIPSQPSRPIPEFAHLTAFPAQERAGLIWVCPSQNDHPILVVPEELEDSKFCLAAYQQPWAAHLTRVVESVLDVAHLPFVHRKTIGRRLPKSISGLKFEVPDTNQIRIYNGTGVLDYWFPQQWLLHTSSVQRNAFINYVAFLPVDRNQTVIFGYAGRTFAKRIPFMNPIFSKLSLRILSEDKSVVESQHPRPIPQALRMEAHVPADAPQVRFRHRWYEFLNSPKEQIHITTGHSTTMD